MLSTAVVIGALRVKETQKLDLMVSRWILLLIFSMPNLDLIFLPFQVFLHFSGKLALIFHKNPLRRQLKWNAKPSFLALKEKKIICFLTILLTTC